jgi:hypothetical protein
MKKTLAALFVLLFVLSGCLEFDAQEVTIRYDEAADRIDIHVVYRGFIAEGGSGSGNDPLAKAIKDLAAARESGEVAFWCNWPFSFDLTRDYVPPVKAMLAHVDVENGALFTDMQGVLCGEQFVRIRDAKSFLKKLNTALDLWVQTQLIGGTSGHGGTHAWDADTKDLVREFQRSGEKLVVVEPGRIELRLPLSAKDHAWFKNQVEQLFLDNMPREIVRHIGIAERRANGGEPTETHVANEAVAVPGTQLRSEITRAPSYRFFWDNELCFSREPEMTRVSFGVRTDKDLRIKKASEGFWHPALLEKLREGGEKIEDGIPDQELVRHFDAFCKRDAVLPPKVVELRAGGDKAKKTGADGK